MKNLVLQKRDITGKKSKRLVLEGLVPCVVYDNKNNSDNYSLDLKDANRLMKSVSSSTIIDAKDGKDEFKIVTKEIDHNPLNGEIRHISFMKLDPNKEIVFSIPFEIKGIAPAVKNNLGVLIKALNAVEVKCNIAHIKDSIEIDISGLEHPGQTITVSDIKLPEGMSLPNEAQRHMAIVTITQLQKTEEVVATTEDATATTDAAKTDEKSE